MNLNKLEKLIKEDMDINSLKIDASSRIKSLLEDYENNFLNESRDLLSAGAVFNELIIDYRSCYILLDKSYGAKPSCRFIFDLKESLDDIAVFTYEIEYDCYGNYSDDFFLLE